MKSTKKQARVTRVKVPKKRAPVRITRSAPAAQTTPLSVPSLAVRSPSRRVMTLTHTEYFFSPSSSVAYGVTSFPVNPGLSVLFPWLSAIASRFEQYRFLNIELVFHTRQPSIAPGTLALMFDYDTLDNPPASLREALQTCDQVADSVWKDIRLRIPVPPAGLRFIRSAFPSTTSYDERVYDLGRLYVMTEGCSGDGSPLGLLEIVYTVDLVNPQVEDPLAARVSVPEVTDSDHYFSGSGNRVVTTHSRIPFKFLQDNAVKFYDNFQGVFSFFVHNLGLGAGAPTPYPTAQLDEPSKGRVTNSMDLLIARNTFTSYDYTWKTVVDVAAGAILRFGFDSAAALPIQWSRWSLFGAAYDQFVAAAESFPELPRSDCMSSSCTAPSARETDPTNSFRDSRVPIRSSKQ